QVLRGAGKRRLHDVVSRRLVWRDGAGGVAGCIGYCEARRLSVQRQRHCLPTNRRIGYRIDQRGRELRGIVEVLRGRARVRQLGAVSGHGDGDVLTEVRPRVLTVEQEVDVAGERGPERRAWGDRDGLAVRDVSAAGDSL